MSTRPAASGDTETALVQPSSRSLVQQGAHVAARNHPESGGLTIVQWWLASVAFAWASGYLCGCACARRAPREPTNG